MNVNKIKIIENLSLQPSKYYPQKDIWFIDSASILNEENGQEIYKVFYRFYFSVHLTIFQNKKLINFHFYVKQ
jgi:hypothetical protein